MKVPVEEMAKMITQMRGLGMDDLFQGSDCTTNPYKLTNNLFCQFVDRVI